MGRWERWIWGTTDKEMDSFTGKFIAGPNPTKYKLDNMRIEVIAYTYGNDNQEDCYYPSFPISYNHRNNYRNYYEIPVIVICYKWHKYIKKTVLYFLINYIKEKYVYPF